MLLDHLLAPANTNFIDDMEPGDKRALLVIMSPMF